jgi:hypothetical protein
MTGCPVVFCRFAIPDASANIAFIPGINDLAQNRFYDTVKDDGPVKVKIWKLAINKFNWLFGQKYF